MVCRQRQKGYRHQIEYWRRQDVGRAAHCSFKCTRIAAWCSLSRRQQATRSEVCEQAKSLGIPVSGYYGRASITADFRNGKTILIAHYRALFNGHSSFGLNFSNEPEEVSAIIIDDAHSSFDTVRASFTVEVNEGDDPDLFRDITSLFQTDFASIDKETTFDEFVNGTGSIGEDVLEVPFWSWLNNYKSIAQLISRSASSENRKPPHLNQLSSTGRL